MHIAAADAETLFTWCCRPAAAPSGSVRFHHSAFRPACLESSSCSAEELLEALLSATSVSVWLKQASHWHEFLFPQCPGVPSRAILVARSWGYAYVTLKQAWHWNTGITNGLRHGTQFGVPVMGRTRDRVRGDACMGMFVRWNSACRIVAWILKCSKVFLRCHDLLRRNCRSTFVPLREQFVNYEQTRLNHWVTKRAHACCDVNILKLCTARSTASPRAPRTLARFPPLLAHRIACHGVNRLLYLCEACLILTRNSTAVSRGIGRQQTRLNAAPMAKKIYGHSYKTAFNFTIIEISRPWHHLTFKAYHCTSCTVCD